MNKYDFMENVRRMRMPVLSLCPVFCTFRMNCPPTSQRREHCEKNGLSYCSCVLIISAISSKPIHKFPSFHPAYIPTVPGPSYLKISCSSHPSVFQRIPCVTFFTQWTLKFSPLSNKDASFLFLFHECIVKFKYFRSCALPWQCTG